MARFEPRVVPPPNPNPLIEEIDRAYILVERRAAKINELIKALRAARNAALNVESRPDDACLKVARIVDEALSEEFPP